MNNKLKAGEEICAYYEIPGAGINLQMALLRFSLFARLIPNYGLL